MKCREKNLTWVCVRCMRFHIGAQNSVNTRLIATLLPEPGQQVSIQSHGDDLLTAWQDDVSVLPEILIRRVCVRVSLDARVNLGIAYLAQLTPVGAALTLRGFRCFASSIVFHEVLLA